MAKSRLRKGTEPEVFVPEVAKQHDVLLARLFPGYSCVLALVSVG